jgi:polar amino acid transport system substrate-binding protein
MMEGRAMREGWSRRSVLGGLAAVGSGLVTMRPSAAETDNGLLARLRKAKVAKVAIAAQPPFSEMLPDGSLAGLGPTVTKIVMEKCGVPKIEGIVVPYGEIIPGLMAGRWDFVAACLSITQVRCKQVLYSDPICFDTVVVGYPQEMEKPPASMAELGKQGLKVGLINGAYMLPMMRGLTTPDKISVFPDVPALIDGMLGRRVDVALATYTGFVAIRKHRQTPFKISPPMTDIKSAGAGPAFRRTDTDLFDAFEKEVKAMKQSGEVAKLNEQLGFQYIRELHDNITMKEACAVAI